MSFRYFYHNEFIHVLNSQSHRLFKRVDEGWIELCHPSEFRHFRLQAVELAPSEVPCHDTLRLPTHEMNRSDE
jgi:hypothetical protein